MAASKNGINRSTSQEQLFSFCIYSNHLPPQKCHVSTLSLHHLKKNTKQLFGSVIMMVLFFFLAHPDTSAEVRLTTSPYTVEMGGKVEEQVRGKYTLNQGNQTRIEIWIFKKNKIEGRDEQAVCAKIITSLEDVQDLK